MVADSALGDQDVGDALGSYARSWSARLWKRL